MPASYQQGFDPQAKQSTRYLARGTGFASCNVDLSQRDVDLTANATNLFEAHPAAARFDFSHPRTIGFRVEMSTATVGTLFRHGSGSPTRLDIAVAGTVRAVVNNVAVGTVAIAGAGIDATLRAAVVAWTSRANPDTLSAADAVESTLHVWRISSGSYARSTFTHSASTAKTQTAFFGAADNVPNSPWTGTITGIWFENRMQSGAEIAADWVAARAVPTTVVAGVHQGHPPLADTIDAAFRHHGPAAMWAVDATRRMQRRTLAPLWNEVMQSEVIWDGTINNPGPLVRDAPGSTTWRMPLSLARLVPVPNTCNAAWVRVHLQSFDDTTTTGVRVYSMNRHPGAAVGEDGPADAIVPYFVGASITRDDTGSEGEWSVLGLLNLSRGTTGPYRDRTVLAIAINDADPSIRVRAVHVVPCFRDQPGGLPFGGFG